MPELVFFKMSASGNDFIVIDNRNGRVNEIASDLAEFASKACRAHHSVGADGVILIESSDEHDFRWRFFNADGSEAEMCGNGGRCAARFAYLMGIAKESMAFETIAGVIKAQVGGSKVKLQLTAPFDLKIDYPIALEDKEIFLSSVNTGVPHAILIVDDVDFVQIIDRENLKLRTYERGVEGETYACGTGAVAAGYILKRKDLIETPVTIVTRGGEALQVHVEEEVYLEGETRLIYEGKLNKEALL